jgi:glycosyltransferase involved in cell wall biosynthesis
MGAAISEGHDVCRFCVTLGYFRGKEATLIRHSVTIVYRFLPRWRADFFGLLREYLATRAISLRLIYGHSSGHQVTHRRLKWGDEVDLPWGAPVENKLWSAGPYDFVWQTIAQELLHSDLVILMQENSILSNHWIRWHTRRRGGKIALWGHGVNLQARRNGLDRFGDLFKKAYSLNVDWWFAYTHSVARAMVRLGFPEDRITPVENAIDTYSLSAERSKQSPESLQRLKTALSLGRGPVGIYCGGLYKDKRIEFLLRSAALIRKQIPTFELIIIGDGPDAGVIRAFSETQKWVHYVGPQYGLNRVPYFCLADICLMPGLVGLGILDSFALEVPMITTAFPYHSPEIEYLENGRNGMMTADNLQEFTCGALEVLQGASFREALRTGCRKSASHYTLENMANRFAAGVESAVAVDSRHPA